MEPQPETATATVRVCGHDIQTTAEELELAGLQVKGPEAFSALSRLVNLRTITTLSKMTFSDAGWESLVAGIKGSPHLTHFNLTACGLGPKHAADFAGIFSSGGCNITTLCLAKNDALTGKRSRDNDNRAPWIYGEKTEGWVALCSALPSTMISLDFSGCALKPKSLTPLTDAIAKMPALNSIALDGCTITGTTFGTSYKEHQGGDYEKIEKLDADLSGFISFCSSPKSSQIVNLSLKKCYLGPQALVVLADAIQFMAALASLTVDSTGSPKLTSGYQSDIDASGPRSYTLNMGEETIDLTKKNLGPADVTLLTAWIQRPEVSAALAVLNISGAFTPFTSSLLSPVHPIDQLTLITGIYYYSPYLPR